MPGGDLALQPGESENAFAAFSIYLGLGTQRSLAKVAAKLGQSKAIMKRWSQQFQWGARVAAYTAHITRVELKSAAARARAKGVDWAKRYQELREAEWQERMNLVTFAAEVRRRWMTKEENCGTLEGYARLVELASKLGHNAFLADGHRAEVAGLSGPIRLELDLALKKIYGQPLPGEDVDVEARNLLSAQTSDFTSS